ncbi:nucleotidyltransferase family protein [Acidiluteibacter ferrifornacis]|uniref:Nucleotidyltransferase n=1 Tax=Acidiluteibacter ferrifornacis TaxID=2692424 RepID=A0A6N9NFG6_9FLAO|nr:nucleotidyltransferase [Acidiluteibacter ferrifornacis]NBG64524.1 nucleotidyltransferase [Acidiluteibacter ferrifornacis]
MTGEQYLKNVIEKHKAPNLSFYDTRLTNVKNEIRSWAGKQLSDIKLSGSCVKKTALKGKADCDLFISLKSDTSNSLSEIYTLLDSHFSNAGYNTRQQNVSIGIKTNGLDIDLVPGKIHSGYKNYHSLYLSKKNSWTQTNIDLHIQNVTNSGRQDEIMLTKTWKDCHNLKFPSIYIELVVIQALKYKTKGQLEKNFISVLEYLRDSFVGTKFTDPANTNNVISDMIFKYQQENIKKAAKSSLDEQYWGQIIW